MGMIRLAIVGSGISGLAAAYYLSKNPEFEITIFESSSQPGGHASTTFIKGIPIDTTVIGFHMQAYPRFRGIVDELGLMSETYPIKHDFCFQSDQGVDYLFSNNPWVGLRNWRKTFRTAALCRYITRKINEQRPEFEHRSFQDFLETIRLSNEEIRRFVFPAMHMFLGIKYQQMLELPASFLLDHLIHYKILENPFDHCWRAWHHGTEGYVKELIQRSRATLHLDTKVLEIGKLGPHGVSLVTSRGQEYFDAILIATTPATALRLLKDVSLVEKKHLAKWPLATKKMVIHRDTRLLARREQLRCFWNPYVSKNLNCEASYLMHKLQPRADRDLIVTWDPIRTIDETKIIEERTIDVWGLNSESIRSQMNLPELNHQKNGLYYCGSYFGLGWHEAAVESAWQAQLRILADANALRRGAV